MKKIIYALCSILIVASSCQDFNERNFDGYEDLTRPRNVVSLTHTISDADINTIVAGLRANKNRADSLLATKLASEKIFSENLSAATLIPYALNQVYFTVDPTSSARVTYQYKGIKDSILAAFATPSYVFTKADYQVVWGIPTVEALTPAKSPATAIPAILAAKFPVNTVKKGLVKNVEYFFSTSEPVVSVVEDKFLDQTFEDHAAGTGVLIDLAGWINKDLIGSFGWQNRLYSNNKYAQVSSYGSGGKNEIWLITPKTTLSATSNAKFTFDIVAGNYNATCLQIMISSNFDGNQNNITSATWTDITSSFTLPTPPSGYSTFVSAGTYDLVNYKGKNVYVAFKYSGDATPGATQITTTYQIDNVKISETVTGLSVSNPEKQFKAYVSDGTAWKLAEDNSTVTLQPADYQSMGLSYLTTTQAPNFIPTWLKTKFPFAQEGDAKTVIYKTSSTENYADKFTYKAGLWTVNSVIETKTDQFVYTAKDRWVFDPTIRVVMKKGKLPTDDYMMVVNHVAQNQAIQTPSLLNSSKDSEYYYGFSGYNGNITVRESDRMKDPIYAALTTAEERKALIDARTEEGLQLYLRLKFPDAPLQVSGIPQDVFVTTRIFYGPTGTNVADFIYEFRRSDTPEKWELLSISPL